MTRAKLRRTYRRDAIPMKTDGYSKGNFLTMSLNKQDVWANLVYALDELKRLPRDFRGPLTVAANPDAESEDEFIHEPVSV